MGREVFKANSFFVIAIVALVWIGFTYVFLTSDFPLSFLLIIFGAGLLVIIVNIKTKVVVEGDLLRYEKFSGEK